MEEEEEVVEKPRRVYQSGAREMYSPDVFATKEHAASRAKEAETKKLRASVVERQEDLAQARDWPEAKKWMTERWETNNPGKKAGLDEWEDWRDMWEANRPSYVQQKEKNKAHDAIRAKYVDHPDYKEGKALAKQEILAWDAAQREEADLAPAGTALGATEDVLELEARQRAVARNKSGISPMNQWTSLTSELATLRKKGVDVSGLEKSIEANRLLQEEELELRRNRNLITDGKQERMIQELASQQEAQQLITKSKKDTFNSITTSIQAATDDLAKNKIHANRIFQNGFTAVLAGIATAVGAYASGLTGGRMPNTASQIIDRAVDLDLKAQMANYQNAKDRLGQMNTLFGRFMDQFGDEEKAAHAFMATSYKWIDARFKQLAASADNEITLNAIDQGRAQAEENAQLEIAKLHEKEHGDHMRSIVEELKAMRMYGGGTGAGRGRGGGSAKIVRGSRQDQENRTAKINNSLARLDSMVDDSGINWASVMVGFAEDDHPFLGGLLSKGLESIDMISEADRNLISRAMPLMGNVLYDIIRLADPFGMISDRDQAFFKSKSITWWDLERPKSLKIKIQEYRELARVVMSISRESGNPTNAYPHSDNPWEMAINDMASTNRTLRGFVENRNSVEAIRKGNVHEDLWDFQGRAAAENKEDKFDLSTEGSREENDGWGK